MRRRGAQIPATSDRVLAGAILAMLLTGSCAAVASPTAAPGGSPAAAVSGLDRVKAAGTLIWCSSTDYPPMESSAADGTAQGLDIDIGAEVAKRLDVTSRIAPTEWESLLMSLGAGTCDLVISSMSSTFGERAEQADFVDCLQVWTALLVAAGNPNGIHNLADLAGKSVAVEPGFAPEASLRAASDGLVAAGKPAIMISTVTRSDEAWVEQLALGQVDALSGDSVDVVVHLAKPPYAGKSEVGGPEIDPQPIGIAIRKGDAGMKTTVAEAIDAIYADGTMKTLVDKWGMTDAVKLLR
jgi:polar amino acid transport system substrate-binding protein